jgi:hypothetical protein
MGLPSTCKRKSKKRAGTTADVKKAAVCRVQVAFKLLELPQIVSLVAFIGPCLIWPVVMSAVHPLRELVEPRPWAVKFQPATRTTCEMQPLEIYCERRRSLQAQGTHDRLSIR